MKHILERLKRLEDMARAAKAVLFPPDDDGFLLALVGDRAEEYRRGDGYDVRKALNDTALEDWADCEPCPDGEEVNENDL